MSPLPLNSPDPCREKFQYSLNVKFSLCLILSLNQTIYTATENPCHVSYTCSGYCTVMIDRSPAHTHTHTHTHYPYPYPTAGRRPAHNSYIFMYMYIMYTQYSPFVFSDIYFTHPMTYQ